MARNISTDLANAASEKVVFPIILVEAEFDSGALRLWAGLGDLEWGGYTWAGGGSLISIDALEESTEVTAVGTSVTLSGIPSELISLALQEDYSGRPLKIYMGAFQIDTARLEKEDGEYVLKEDMYNIDLFTEQSQLAEPVVVFSGRMDVMSLQEGGNVAAIKVSVENRMIDFERTRERRYTSEDQKIDYPNDKGLEFVASIQDTEIVWGRV